MLKQEIYHLFYFVRNQKNYEKFFNNNLYLYLYKIFKKKFNNSSIKPDEKFKS